jgi:hypothetical protein
VFSDDLQLLKKSRDLKKENKTKKRKRKEEEKLSKAVTDVVIYQGISNYPKICESDSRSLQYGQQSQK